MQFKRSVTTVRTVGRSFAATQTEAAVVKLLASDGGFAFWRQKYRNGERIWYLQCERGNIRNKTSPGVNRCLLYLTAFFQVAIFHATLAIGWTIRGITCAVGTRDVFIF